MFLEVQGHWRQRRRIRDRRKRKWSWGPKVQWQDSTNNNQNDCLTLGLPCNSEATTFSDVMFVNHKLIKQKQMLEEKMKAMKNKQKQAKISINRNQWEKDAKKQKYHIVILLD